MTLRVPSTILDYLSCSPVEIQMEIYKQCDALTLFLNWDDALTYLPSSAHEPTPLEIWIATLQTDAPVYISKLPLVDRNPHLVTEYSGKHECLPDASVLSRFIRSKSMLQNIYNSRLPVPADVFSTSPPHSENAVHAAMRNCWFEMIDIWNMSEKRKVDFAIRGSHWEYFQHLLTLIPETEILHRKNNFFDYAAWNGALVLLKRLPVSISGSKKAMDWAAQEGHLQVVKWLHENRSEGCTSDAMDGAAQEGHLDVVKWLHENRSEGCTSDAMDGAAQEGHLDVVKWLHENRSHIFVNV